MPIPAEYAHRFLYHITSVDNLKSILTHGLLSTNEKNMLGIEHNDIALRGIQDTRDVIPVTCGPGGMLHDYVPLYFCIKTPMLYSVQIRNVLSVDRIIYLEFPIDMLCQDNAVFSDCSANSKWVQTSFYDNPSDLNKLDWGAIDKKYWGKDENDPFGNTIKRKQAEALIYKKLPLNTLRRIVVYNNDCLIRVKEILRQCNCTSISISVNPGYYYSF